MRPMKRTWRVWASPSFFLLRPGGIGGHMESESGRAPFRPRYVGGALNEPLEDDADRDDEAVERYSFHHYDLVLDKRLPRRRRSLRFDRRDRPTISRLCGTTRPTVWARASLRRDRTPAIGSPQGSPRRTTKGPRSTTHPATPPLRPATAGACATLRGSASTTPRPPGFDTFAP